MKSRSIAGEDREALGVDDAAAAVAEPGDAAVVGDVGVVDCAAGAWVAAVLDGLLGGAGSALASGIGGCAPATAGNAFAPAVGTAEGMVETVMPEAFAGAGGVARPGAGADAVVEPDVVADAAEGAAVLGTGLSVAGVEPRAAGGVAAPGFAALAAAGVAETFAPAAAGFTAAEAAPAGVAGAEAEAVDVDADGVDVEAVGANAAASGINGSRLSGGRSSRSASDMAGGVCAGVVELLPAPFEVVFAAAGGTGSHPGGSGRVGSTAGTLAFEAAAEGGGGSSFSSLVSRAPKSSASWLSPEGALATAIGSLLGAAAVGAVELLPAALEVVFAAAVVEGVELAAGVSLPEAVPAGSIKSAGNKSSSGNRSGNPSDGAEAPDFAGASELAMATDGIEGKSTAGPEASGGTAGSDDDDPASVPNDGSVAVPRMIGAIAASGPSVSGSNGNSSSVGSDIGSRARVAAGAGREADFDGGVGTDGISGPASLKGSRGARDAASIM